MTIIKTCANPKCGHNFSPRKSGGNPQIFCCQRCTHYVAGQKWRLKNPERNSENRRQSLIRKRDNRERKRLSNRKTCVECSSEFYSNYKIKRFCSQSCQKEFARRYRPKAKPRLVPIRRCANPECGSNFQPYRSSNIFCSKQCFNRCWNKKKCLNYTDKVKCAECGVKFTRKSKKSRFCCKTCCRKFTVRAWNLANPERVRTNRQNWQKENREKLNAYQAEWAKNNRDKRKKYVRKWKDNNYDTYIASRRKLSDKYAALLAAAREFLKTGEK